LHQTFLCSAKKDEEERIRKIHEERLKAEAEKEASESDDEMSSKRDRKRKKFFDENSVSKIKLLLKLFPYFLNTIEPVYLATQGKLKMWPL
jgi:uncharacterized protein (UPF0305 family)